MVEGKQTSHDSNSLCQRRGNSMTLRTDRSMLLYGPWNLKAFFIDVLLHLRASEVGTEEDVVGVSAATRFNMPRQRPNCGRHDKTQSKPIHRPYTQTIILFPFVALFLTSLFPHLKSLSISHLILKRDPYLYPEYSPAPPCDPHALGVFSTSLRAL